MNKPFAIFLAAAAVSITPASADPITMAWSPVGNAGNPADTTVMSDGTSGYGSVPYTYNIGTYDVTTSQYATFLNSNDPTGANRLGLYNTLMSTSGSVSGINYDFSAANGSKYSFISGDGNHPVNFVSFYDAIRFANWMNNGQLPGIPRREHTRS